MAAGRQLLFQCLWLELDMAVILAAQAGVHLQELANDLDEPRVLVLQQAYRFFAVSQRRFRRLGRAL